MINNQQYENLIELLKKALEFYANTDNYTQNVDVNNTSFFSKIQMDSGAQAKFALSKINEINDANKKIQDEYNELTNNMIKNIDDDSNSIEINNFLKIYNSLNNENNNI